MARDVPKSLKVDVALRASLRCEYCLIPERYIHGEPKKLAYAHHVDHVTPLKHGGSSAFENLAYACLYCNLHKGTDMFSVDERGSPVRLFNPREQSWHQHFRIEGAIIQPLTPEGEATVRLLKMNDSRRVVEREGLRRLGLYPGLTGVVKQTAW